MDGVTRPSVELNRHLHLVKELAENAEEGSTFFIEVSYQPLVSLFVTTGKVIKDQPDKHSVHLRFVSEPHHYSEVLNEVKVTDTYVLGFNLYNQLTDNIINKLEMVDYKKKFDKVCKELDVAKKKYHGICCYEDGEELNASISNVFILHICDIMNLLVCKENGIIPQVELGTNLLKEIGNKVCIANEVAFITKSNSDFFMRHIDHFYVCYAYVSNTSFTPIRTRVNKDSSIFVRSSFFTNDDHFNNHQAGKLNLFNQNNEQITSRMIYRSI